MSEAAAANKAKQIFANAHLGWRFRNGRLRPIGALIGYIGIVCLFGLVGVLPISNNMILHPNGAGAIDTVLLAVALGHGLWAALVWRQWLRISDSRTWMDPLLRTVQTLLMFLLASFLCHAALMRGAPFASTYVWGTQQSLDIRLESVQLSRPHGPCSNRWVLGIARRDYVMKFAGSRWSSETFCVSDYDGEVLPRGTSWIDEHWMTATGQGNWLAFRMDSYQMR